MRPNFERKKPEAAKSEPSETRSREDEITTQHEEKEDMKRPSAAVNPKREREDNIVPLVPFVPLVPSNPWDTQSNRTHTGTVPQYPSVAPSTERSNVSQKKVPAALKGWLH